MPMACRQGSNENESECQLAAAPAALSRWRRWNESTFSPTSAPSLVQKWKNPGFPASEVKGCFLPRYATVHTFSPESHVISVPFSPLGCLRKMVCLGWGGMCCLPPLKGTTLKWGAFQLTRFSRWESPVMGKWYQDQMAGKHRRESPQFPKPRKLPKQALAGCLDRQLVLGWGDCWLLHAFIILKPAHLPETPPFGPSSGLSWPSPL